MVLINDDCIIYPSREEAPVQGHPLKIRVEQGIVLPRFTVRKSHRTTVYTISFHLLSNDNLRCFALFFVVAQQINVSVNGEGFFEPLVCAFELAYFKALAQSVVVEK